MDLNPWASAISSRYTALLHESEMDPAEAAKRRKKEQQRGSLSVVHLASDEEEEEEDVGGADCDAVKEDQDADK